MAITSNASIFKSKKYTITSDSSSIEALQITLIAPENAEDDPAYWVTFGTFGGIIPSSVETAFTPAVSKVYVYVKGTISSTGDDAEVSSAAIEISSTVKSNTLGEPPIDIYYLIGIIDGGSISNSGGGSINIHIIKEFSVIGSTLKRRFRYTFIR